MGSGPSALPSFLGTWHFSWSWGESNPRPSGGDRPCYDHSRVRGSRCPTAGSADLTRRPTDRLSDPSAVFPAASLLSGGHPPLLLPGCGGSAPCGLAAHDVCLLT